MVRDPTPEIIVESLEWDEENEEHLLKHGVSIGKVEEVLANRPRFFLNLDERTATHVMIGPSFDDRFYYVPILESETSGRWRPVTGWSLSRERALRIYQDREA